MVAKMTNQGLEYIANSLNKLTNLNDIYIHIDNGHKLKIDGVQKIFDLVDDLSQLKKFKFHLNDCPEINENNFAEKKLLLTSIPNESIMLQNFELEF